jgi:hypothetical protein
MPRILPSDVVVMIEQQFPWVVVPKAPGVAEPKDSSAIAGLLEVLEQIPEDLLPSAPDKYRDFLWGFAGLRSLVRRLESGTVSMGGGWPWPLVGMENAVVKIRSLLKECPDEAIASRTDTLTFVDDGDFRESLRQDISSTEDDLNNGSWKSATVIAGSVVEALLLWAISQHDRSEVEAQLSPGQSD